MSSPKALRALIKASGLTINAWAKQVTLRQQGVSPRTVRRWLAGTSPIPEQVLSPRAENGT